MSVVAKIAKSATMAEVARVFNLATDHINKLKYKFTVHKDIDDEFEIVDNDIKDETKKSLVRKLLIRNCDFQEIIIKKEFENEIKEIL